MGADFTSETDAEVIAHLISHHMARGSLVEAVRAAYAELEGHYAFVAMSADEPGTLVGARKECPLIVGRGDGEQFLGSAVPAFLAHTRDVQFIENGEIVVVRPDGVQFLTPDGTPLEREITHVDWDEATAEKGGYETFMLKEIHEQADAVAETIADRTARGTGVDLAEAELDESLLQNIDRILILAAGTSFHAGLIGRYAIEEWARIPVDMDIASEWRYRNPIVAERELVIGITQSGETADTLAAMRLAQRARREGARRARTSSARRPRATPTACSTRAPASRCRSPRRRRSSARSRRCTCSRCASPSCAARWRPSASPSSWGRSSSCPTRIAELIERLDAPVKAAAERHADSDFYLYLGRHVGRAVALEGALKLKEISYIATDAYAGGEMKHGPIALLDESTPVVCVATDMPILDKMISNIQEVRARGAHVIAIATEGDDAARRRSPRRSSTSRARTGCCRRCSRSSRCSCSPTTSRASAG